MGSTSVLAPQTSLKTTLWRVVMKRVVFGEMHAQAQGGRTEGPGFRRRRLQTVCIVAEGLGGLRIECGAILCAAPMEPGPDSRSHPAQSGQTRATRQHHCNTEVPENGSDCRI